MRQRRQRKGEQINNKKNWIFYLCFYMYFRKHIHVIGDTGQEKNIKGILHLGTSQPILSDGRLDSVIL